MPHVTLYANRYRSFDPILSKGLWPITPCNGVRHYREERVKIFPLIQSDREILGLKSHCSGTKAGTDEYTLSD